MAPVYCIVGMATVKALRHGFSNSPKIRRLADPVLVTLDLLNSKSTGFNIASRTTSVCKVSSNSVQGFSFYPANTHPHTPTYIPTLYYAVGADNYWRPCVSDAQLFDINKRVSDNYQSSNITY